ncbi:hypothetical protein GCM10023063_35710 [Arthrobacter methylotrophus]
MRQFGLGRIGHGGRVAKDVHSLNVRGGQVRADIDAASPPLPQTGGGNDPSCLQSTGPHHDPAGYAGPVGERHSVGADFGHADSQVQPNADLRQASSGVVLRLYGKSTKDGRDHVDQVDTAAGREFRRKVLGHHELDVFGQGAGCLDARGAAADDHDVHGAAGLPVGFIQQVGQPRTQSGGVSDRIQQEGMLLRARCVEKAWYVSSTRATYST